MLENHIYHLCITHKAFQFKFGGPINNSKEGVGRDSSLPPYGQPWWTRRLLGDRAELASSCSCATLGTASACVARGGSLPPCPPRVCSSWRGWRVGPFSWRARSGPSTSTHVPWDRAEPHVHPSSGRDAGEARVYSGWPCAGRWALVTKARGEKARQAEPVISAHAGCFSPARGDNRILRK